MTVKKPSPVRGLIAGIVVVVLAVAAYFTFFSGDEKPQKEVTTKERSRIKEVTSAAAPTNAVAKAEKPKKERPQIFGEIRNGYRLLPNGKLHKVHGVHTSHVARISLASRIFDEPANQDIGQLISTEPGTPMIGKSSDYYHNFDKLFLKSLDKKIEIKPDDSEEAKELKQAVIDIRAELKARREAGEDLVKIMRETRDQLVELGNYRQELEAEVQRIASDPDKELSQRDIDDLVGAANQMLKDRGSQPLSMNGAMTYRFRKNQLARQRRKAAKEAEQKGNN